MGQRGPAVLASFPQPGSDKRRGRVVLGRELVSGGIVFLKFGG